MAPTIKMMEHHSNILNWEWDDGYKSDMNTENEYPLRSTESGLDSGLQITFVNHDHDRSLCCNIYNQYFDVYLSAPGESVDMEYSNEFDFKVPISTNSFLSMRPKLITTSQGLRSYSPNERGCFYNNERQLAFFKIYSESNCLLECAANYSVQGIGCVEFHQTRECFIE